MTLAKCFKLIHKDQDAQQLQQDLESSAKWSEDWNLFFNTNKFIHLSFNTRFTMLTVPQLHLLAHIEILALQFLPISHGMNITSILAKAYRTLGLLRHTTPSISKKSLYNINKISAIVLLTNMASVSSW